MFAILDKIATHSTFAKLWRIFPIFVIFAEACISGPISYSNTYRCSFQLKFFTLVYNANPFTVYFCIVLISSSMSLIISLFLLLAAIVYDKRAFLEPNSWFILPGLF